RAVVHDLQTGEAAEVPLQLQGGGGCCDLTPDGRHVVVGQTHTGAEPPSLLFCRPVAELGALAWSVTSPRWVYSGPHFLAGGRRFVVLEYLHRPRAAGGGLVYVTRDGGTGAAEAEVPAAGDSFYGQVQSADGRLIAGLRGAWIGVLSADDLG